MPLFQQKFTVEINERQFPANQVFEANRKEAIGENLSRRGSRI